MKRIMHKRGNWAMNALVIIALVVVIAGGGAYLVDRFDIKFGSTASIGGDDDDTPSNIQYTQELGASATIGLNSFTGSWGSAGTKSEVYPIYTVKTRSGNTQINDAPANSTSAAVGDVLNIYPTGSAYYFDPVLGYEVKKQTDAVADIQAQAVVSTSDLEITVYDEDETTALTADDNANNTADYAGGALGAGETRSYYAKIKNTAADKTFRLGAILTYYCGDEADDFKLDNENFVEVSIPSGDLRTDFTHRNDANSSVQCSVKHAYKVSGKDYIELKEYKATPKMQFVFDADDTTGPSANGLTYFGAIFVDYSYEQDENGAVIGDWYKHNQDNDPSDVGLNEDVIASGFKGLDVGFAVEPQ